jgi:hypothetical protein
MIMPKKKRATKKPAGCWNCGPDPSGKLKQMFVDIVQTGQIKRGQTPMWPVFRKVHGAATGAFVEDSANRHTLSSERETG